MNRVLFVATVVRKHINEFHVPYMKLFHDNKWIVDVVAKNDFIPKDKICIPYADNFFEVEFDRKPWSIANIEAYRKLKKIIEANKYDLVICNTPVGGAISRLAGHGENCKILYIAHGFHFFKGNSIIKNFVFRNIESWLAKYTDALVTINNEDYQAASKFTYNKNGKAFLINGIGCDIDNITSVSVDKAKKRDELSIDVNSFVVMTTAEMIPRKNYEVALKAFALANIRNSVYLVCGDGELNKKLKGLAKYLGIEGQVKFLGYRNDIAELLAISDVFLFTSLQEGLGISIIEAESAGVPVITSNVRGSKDCVVNGKTGYTYNPRDINGFAEGLKKIHDMGEIKRGDMVAAAKEYAMQFDISKSIKQMMQVYEYLGIHLNKE